jgi:hypothetical protein
MATIHVALPIASTQEEYDHDQTKDDKEVRFVERIHHFFQQVNDILQKANAK